MKVLAVIDSLRLGGAERLMATLARAGRGSFELDVVSLSGQPGADKMSSVLLDAGVRPISLGLRRLADPRGVPALVHAIRASGCDVVHAHLDESIVLGSVASRLARRPLVCTLHTPWLAGLPFRERIVRRVSVHLAGYAAALVFVSWGSLGSFAARCRERRNWLVVHNGVDTEEFHPGSDTFPADIRIRDGVATAILVGRLDPHKGVLDVVEAWPQVLDAVPDARLLLVGSTPDEAAVRNAIARAGIGEHTVTAGVRRDVARLMRASAVVLLPTRVDAFPTMLMEAGASGKPVVSTVVGGIPEIVDHGRSGLLVFPGDRSGLADSIVTILTNPDRAAEMGMCARQIVEARLDAREFVKHLLTVYDAVADGRRVTQDLLATAPP